MVGHALRHPKELYNIIIKSMVEGKRTIDRPYNSYIEQTKNDAKVKTFKEPKKRQAIY